MNSNAWDRVVDVVVVGSGAGGLTAALTAAVDGADVEVLEKADLLGGTSAWSGGMPWVPRNSHMPEVDATDSREEALEYINGLTEQRAHDPSLIERFVDEAAGAIDFLEAHSAVRLTVTRAWSDYFADRPGGKLSGRSLEPLPMDSPGILGAWHDKVRDSPHIPRLTQDEMAALGSQRALPVDETGKVPAGAEELIARRERDQVRVMGPALISGIVRGLVDEGVTLTTGTPVTRLVVEDGAVVGVEADDHGATVRIGARRGVVLASGGFEWNEDLVLAYLGSPHKLPLSPPTNVGDGLVMGLEIGAAVGNMSNAVAFPATYDEHSTYEGAPIGNLATPRADPGVVGLNKHGRRFVNEGITYMDIAKVHAEYDPVSATYPNEGPGWWVFDESVRGRHIISDFAPGAPTPTWVKTADTLEGLAAEMDLDPAVLVEEIERFNGHVEAGVDPDFHRGEIWWEGYQTEGPQPGRHLAKVETGPFYALKMYDGILGTVGGLRIDADARVLRQRGGVVDGLYAVGNVAAGIFGQVYPGGGSTLGPGITFGHLAGRHAAAREVAPALREAATA